MQCDDLPEPCEEEQEEVSSYEDYMFEETSGSSYSSSSSPQAYYHVVSANPVADLPWDYNLHSDPEFVEVEFTGNTWKLLSDVEHTEPPKAVETVALRRSIHNK